MIRFPHACWVQAATRRAAGPMAPLVVEPLETARPSTYWVNTTPTLGRLDQRHQPA
jgi:hypothetical protein